MQGFGKPRKYLRHKLLCVMELLACVLSVEIIAAYDLVDSHAFASTRGTIGPTSTGSFTFSVTKVSAARISGLNDMVISWPATDTDIIWSSDVCVISSRASGTYTIMATGSARAGGAFIISGANATLPYKVAWDSGRDGNLSNNRVSLTPGVTSPPVDGASTDDRLCQGSSAGRTARLVITIPRQSLRAAAPGSYSDTLTLLVSPN